ncbi:MAG: Lsr2 family protein [Actinomycetota bacterium]|nr:Lsr2 family protein [Actinomycetota bacterium]
METEPLALLKAPQIISADVQHFLHGSLFLTRAFIERFAGDDVTDSTETVDFSYRGVDYRVDLSARNAKALDKLLTQIVEAACYKVPRPATPRRSADTRNSAPPAKAVRAWAKNQGIKVSDRGRISTDVTQRYQDAHGR